MNYKPDIKRNRTEFLSIISIWIFMNVVAVFVAMISNESTYDNVAHYIWPPSDRLTQFCQYNNCIYSSRFISILFSTQILSILIITLPILVSILINGLSMSRSGHITSLIIFLTVLWVNVSSVMSMKFDFEMSGFFSSAISHSYISIFRVFLLGFFTILIAAGLFILRNRKKTPQD